MTETPTGDSAGGGDALSGYPVYDPDQASTVSDPGRASAATPETAPRSPASEPPTTESPTSGTAAPEPAAAPPPEEDLLARTRASGTWVAIIIFALVLILLLIFVLQNTQPANVSYFTANFKLPLAVAMLLSAVAGVLLTAIAGTLRILQIRHRVRKSQRS